jgi:Rieske Fe-S protein
MTFSHRFDSRMIPGATPADAGCGSCPLVTDRRTFLQRSTAALGATLVALGLSAKRAHALSFAPTWITSEPRTGLGEEISYALPAKDGVQIDKERETILVRSLGSVYVFALSCPHQKTSLRWNESEDRFICPKHKSEYSADGYFVTGRATRGMDRYIVKLKDDKVIVDLTQLKKESDDPDGWKAAVITLPKPKPAARP